MRVGDIGVLLLLGAGFVASTLWYVSTHLQSRFERARIEAAIGSRVARSLLLVSRSRFPDRRTNAGYIATTGFLASFLFLFVILIPGPARLIGVASLMICVAIATYGFIVLRRLEATREHVASPIFHPVETTRLHVASWLIFGAALTLAYAMNAVVSGLTGDDYLALVVMSLTFGLSILGVLVLRRRNRLFGVVRLAKVGIQADSAGLQLTLEGQPRLVPWQEIEELRSGPFPWWSTVLFDADSHELATIHVGPCDPIVSSDEDRSTIARLLVSNNPGTFVIDRWTIGRDVRLRRRRPDEVGAVEADLDARRSRIKAVVWLPIVVIGVWVLVGLIARR